MSLALAKEEPAVEKEAPRDQSSTRFRVVDWLISHVIVVALVIECVVFSFIGTNFLTASDFKLVLTQVSDIALMAVPGAMLVMAGFIDFTVGSLVSLVGVIVGFALQSHGVVFACAIGLLVGGAVGAFQGILIMVFNLPTMIVTLGLYGAIGGYAVVVAHGEVSNSFSNGFALIGQGVVDGINVPVPIVIAVAAFVVGSLFLYRTRWGRHVVAIGSNRTAAYRVGIKVRTLVVGLYVASGMAAALAALILASELNSTPPVLGQGLELSVISAVLLGGVAFTGGSGSLLGVAAAVLFIGVLDNGLILAGVSAYWQQVSSGIALVAAAALTALTHKWRVATRGR